LPLPQENCSGGRREGYRQPEKFWMGTNFDRGDGVGDGTGELSKAATEQ